MAFLYQNFEWTNKPLVGDHGCIKRWSIILKVRFHYRRICELYVCYVQQGDGSTMCPAQWTYTGHRKSVLSVGFCETARLAVSCDSAVHLWDPYVGRVVAVSDSARCPPVNTLRPLSPPSHQVQACCAFENVYPAIVFSWLTLSMYLLLKLF